MNFRPGTCRSCGARYRMPLDFPATRAQCKQCQGIVDVPELEAPAAAAEVTPPLEVIAPANGAKETQPPNAPPAPSRPEAKRPPEASTEKPVVLQPAAPQASKPRAPIAEDKTPAQVPVDEAPAVPPKPASERVSTSPPPPAHVQPPAPPRVEAPQPPKPPKAEPPKPVAPEPKSVTPDTKPPTETKGTASPSAADVPAKTPSIQPTRAERSSAPSKREEPAAPRNTEPSPAERGRAAKRSLADKASSRAPEAEAPRGSAPADAANEPKGTSPTLQKILARKREESEAASTQESGSNASSTPPAAKKGGTLEKILARKRAEQPSTPDPAKDSESSEAKTPSPTLQKILARKRAAESTSRESAPPTTDAEQPTKKGGTLQQILARKRAQASSETTATDSALESAAVPRKPSLRGRPAKSTAPAAREVAPRERTQAAAPSARTRRERREEGEHDTVHRHNHGLHSGHHATGTGVSNKMLLWSSVAAVVVLGLSLLLIFSDGGTPPAETTSSTAVASNPSRAGSNPVGAQPSEASLPLEQANTAGATGDTGQPVEAGVSEQASQPEETNPPADDKLPPFRRTQRDALAKVEFADVPDTVKKAIDTLGQEGGPPTYMRGPIRDETLPAHPRASYAQALNTMIEIAQTKFTGTTDPAEANDIETAALQIYELQQALVALTSRAFDTRKINLAAGGEERAVQRAMVFTQNGALEEIQNWIDYWKTNQLDTEAGWNAMAERNEKESGRKVPRAGGAGKGKVVEEEAPPGGDPGF